MSEASDKVALVYDHSINLPFAQALGRGFEQVLYYNADCRSAASKSNKAHIGEGMSYVTRVDSFWDNLDLADVIVFPFLGDGDLQARLQKQGYLVWGDRRADLLELDRQGFRKVVKGLGLPTADTDEIVGFDRLKDYLQENDDRFLKASFFRGDFETFHHVNWKLSQQWYEEKKLRLGPYADRIQILAEAKIEGKEPGWDGFTIDGQYPKEPMWGYELKGKAYAGTRQGMPEGLADIASELSPMLETLGARGNFHFEARVTEDGTTYIIDPTLRIASPAGESMLALISNWPEIVWHGAHGELVEPDYRAKWAAQLVLKSQWSCGNYLSVWVPEEFQDSVMFYSARKYEDVVAVMPGEDELIGNAVGIGDTLEEAIDRARTVADSVEGYQLEYTTSAKEELAECFGD